MIYAPIIIPTMCRSAHFMRLIESLKRNSWACYTDVYVGLDYPPSEKYEKGWEEICEYLEKNDFHEFKKFIVFKRNVNYGVQKNYGALVQYMREHYDRWIQTDDDCEYSENFLEYIDKCLYEYENDESIVAVTGYSYPIEWTAYETSTCFSQNFNVSTWGLGLWEKKYARFSEEICSGNMLKKANECVKRGLYKQMLDVCKIEYFAAAAAFRRHSLMTWPTDIAMRAYLAVGEKYCISPIVSKVRNNGFDGTGCFCAKTRENSECEAQRYDYSKQVIDSSKSFEIHLDCDESHLDDNRRKLNAFDSRPFKNVTHAHHIIWLIGHCGLCAAKLFQNTCLFGAKIKKKYRAFKNVFLGAFENKRNESSCLE